MKMKKPAKIVLLAACLSILVALPLAAASPAEELATILTWTGEELGAMVGQGYTIEHIEVDSLKLGEKYVFPITLSGSCTYQIHGLGGDGIQDLDIIILDKAGNIVAADTLDDDHPICEGTPPADGNYQIVVSAEQLEASYSKDIDYYFALIVGWKK